MSIAALRKRQAIKAEARAFMIWREGISVAWKCTLWDLSEATGLPYDTVQVLCKTRRWPVQRDDYGPKRRGPRDLTGNFPKAAARPPHRAGGPRHADAYHTRLTAVPALLRRSCRAQHGPTSAATVVERTLLPLAGNRLGEICTI
jgi:hypothetical protein